MPGAPRAIKHRDLIPEMWGPAVCCARSVVVKGLIWLGTRTERFDEMVSFAEVCSICLRTAMDEAGLAEFELARWVAV